MGVGVDFYIVTVGEFTSQEFCGQWIAVDGERVIDSDPDLDTLLSKLERPGQVCIEYVTREPLEMVL